jgi:predicted MPP superfamily phosphohydrolase
MNTSRTIEHGLTRRDFLRLVTEFTGALAVVGATSSFYSLKVEPGWIDVENVEIRLPNLPVAFSGFCITQISDIHFGGWMNRERLADVVDLTLDTKPDLIVVTGDHVDGEQWTSELDAVVDGYVVEMSRLGTKYPTLGILGNHDHWTDAGKVRELLVRSNILELKNDVYSIEKGGGQMHIAGVDDIWLGYDRMDEVLAKLPDSGPAILLAHEPDYADTSAATRRFDLQLSGHSHGGQIVVPFSGPVLTPHLGVKYPSGLYRVGDMWQYTNRGVGMIGLGVRLNCRPEITVFTLKPA